MLVTQLQGRAQVWIQLWTIENVTSDVVHKGATGVVSFHETDSTLSIVSGNFAAAGVVHASVGAPCFIPSAEIDYRLFGNDLMYLSWKGALRENPSSQFDQDATMTVFASDPDTLRIVGNGGCGEVGKPRISILRRVTEIPPTATPINTPTPTPPSDPGGAA